MCYSNAIGPGMKDDLAAQAIDRECERLECDLRVALEKFCGGAHVRCTDLEVAAYDDQEFSVSLSFKGSPRNLADLAYALGRR